MIDLSRVTFTEPDAPDAPGHLRVRRLTAMGWWKDRQHAERYQVDAFPTLDELWTLHLCFLQDVPPELEAMCRYTEDARQGRWVDRGPPEHALQAVYLALAQQLLPDHARFVEEAEALFATKDFATNPRFQRYVSALVDDQRYFAEDLKRSEVWRVPIEHRTVTLLVLDRPTSTQFKLWARRDEQHALLLVRQADGTLVLSADPSSKLRVSQWAPELSKRDGRGWYAGERHDGTLIASAREGTRLGFPDVRQAIGARRPRSVIPWFAMAVALLIFAALIPRQTTGGAKGEPLEPAQVVDLLARSDGPKSFGRYALVVGVCNYSGEHALEAPCNDARAVQQALVGLGFSVDLLLDADAPTLKLAVERFRERHAEAGPQSSFVFYYSGHGGYEKGARKDFGLLQPAGYFEHPDAPMADRGWDMQELVDDLRKGIPSKHVMLILDACYAGWAAGAKGDAMLSPEVRSLWQERAEVVLTAGTKGQRAWEDDGRSIFTADLLEGLGGAADLNSDSVITDEELAAYVRRRVPGEVRERKKAEQTPQFIRFDEALPKTGQFLFVR